MKEPALSISRWAIFISALALLACCLIACYVFYRNECQVLEFDYQGVIVAIFGVLISLLVAWNIWNVIDTKKTVEKVDEKANEMVFINQQIEDTRKDIDYFRCYMIAEKLMIESIIWYNDKNNENPLSAYDYILDAINEYANIENQGSAKIRVIKIIADAIKGLDKFVDAENISCQKYITKCGRAVCYFSDKQIKNGIKDLQKCFSKLKTKELSLEEIDANSMKYFDMYKKLMNNSKK